MRFTPDFLDEIKTRLTVSDIVGRRVRLKKQGREWRGLSPFNTERTPSFFVNDSKMAWFDFSSGRNGNIFDFLMATEGLTFPEAVERLAGEAGLDLPTSTPEAVAREQQRAGLTEVLEFAAQYFERNLADRAGARARSYLDGRGLPAELRHDFRMGYALAERFALRDHLAGKGAGTDIMIEAGLLVPWRRHRGAVRLVPRPGDLPDRRPVGPRDRVRGPGARGRRAGQIPEFSRDGAVPQGIGAVQPPQGPQACP